MPPDEYLGRAGGRVSRHTLVLTTGLRAANAFNLTRIDLPFLLGTAFTSDRTHAKALGYGAHFINGQIFALLYDAVFAAIGYSSWRLATVFGLVHGLLAATALVNILPPLVHPRTGTPQTSAPHVSHYSNHRASSCSTTAPATHRHPAAHLAYGTIIGGFPAWPS